MKGGWGGFWNGNGRGETNLGVRECDSSVVMGKTGARGWRRRKDARMLKRINRHASLYKYVDQSWLGRRVGNSHRH